MTDSTDTTQGSTRTQEPCICVSSMPPAPSSVTSTSQADPTLSSLPSPLPRRRHRRRRVHVLLVLAVRPVQQGTDPFLVGADTHRKTRRGRRARDLGSGCNDKEEGLLLQRRC